MLNEDYKEMLQKLLENKVEFLVVGAYAMAVHGYPRAARFKAANILDRKLHRRAEALELYQEALIKETQFDEWRGPAQRRVKELTSSDSK